MAKKESRSGRSRVYSALLACTAFTGAALQAQTHQIERPAITTASTDLGRIQPAAQITLTVHLNMHDQTAFDNAVKELYTPGSSTYHRWMTRNQIAGYAPTADEVQSVISALKSNGLSVLSTAPDNLSVRVRGPAEAVENAFQTQIHEFKHQGKTFHANVTPATLAGAAGSLVRGVTGLTNFPLRSNVKYQVNPKTGQRIIAQQATGSGFSGIATNNCFGDPSAVTLTTSGSDLPFGVYVGNTYDTSGVSCSWTPSQLQSHYALAPAYSQGLDGTGQTIVIVDGPTDGALLQSDLTLFANLAGLPAITSSNFTVLYPDGKPTQLALEADNWQDEASLDVEWAHSIAPGAKIVIEIMPSEDWDEFELAIDYARVNGLGNVVSNSYGLPEALFGAYTVQGFEQVLENAAAAGIAVNFSSGDGGDEGTGSPSGGGVLYPASSTYATSIGGTSIGIPNGTANGAEIGWGNNAAYLSFGLNEVLDPPLGLGFLGGAGGGSSTFFNKPSWQSALPGTARQSPDIAALADPYTGVVFVLNGTPSAGIGGTSLACPIFSALWAIADQAAGASLGQAAPLLYQLPSTAINDVIPVNSTTNVSGIIVDSSGETDYSPGALLAPLYTTTQYSSALWNLGSGIYVDLSFGTDSSLTVTSGWDNVTGLGVPNGLAFINAVVSAH
jgi:subtilase family serine protease